MKIFKAEKEAGLAAQLKASGAVAYISQLQPVAQDTALATRIVRAAASEQHPSETLYPIRDVLVTTGWNLNTDIFDNGETWVARNTPVHHPLNFEHDEKHIIGNITASHAVNDEMEQINDDLAVDELPSKFHILNSSVIYKVWQDAAQQELIEKTIAEIEKGEWYVSMECVFKGFDYGVMRPDGTMGVITRNEESAFLTKHLRHYQGSGVYKSAATGEEFKLGRVLRNINFIGKGLVRRPANPESIILNHVSAFANLGYIKVEAEVTSTKQPERTDMSEPNVDVKRLEDKVAELLKQNEALATQLKEKDGESVKATIDGLKGEVASRDQKIETLEASFSELKKSVEEMTKRANEAEAAKTVAEEALSKLHAEKVEQARLAVLTGKGASTEKAAELVKKFSKFSEEEFNDLVETLSAAWKKPEAVTKTPEQVINNATPVKEPAMATASTKSDTTDENVAKASKFIGGFLRYNKNVPAATQD